MKQERLNSLMTLHALKEKIDGLSLFSVANTFLGGNETRLCELGKF